MKNHYDPERHPPRDYDESEGLDDTDRNMRSAIWTVLYCVAVWLLLIAAVVAVLRCCGAASEELAETARELI